MKIIISPAKKMNIDLETIEPQAYPVFLQQTEVILQKLWTMSLEELKVLWKCNDKIAIQNYERIHSMTLREKLTPAILSYEGIQYQYMAPTIFENNMLEYVQEHLCILSGFYGVLRPMDGVTPYRLEMQAKLTLREKKNLYEYWGDSLYESIVGEKQSQVIVNLASKEYSICVERYLKQNERFITCVFGEDVNGKVVQKGTYAKMARGEMVRYMAENQIHEVEEIKEFDRLGYAYSEEHSTSNTWTFLK